MHSPRSRAGVRWQTFAQLGMGGKISVQGTGMGCPGATIVFEELIQLGCKKLIRVGTCGSLQQEIKGGSLIVPTAGGKWHNGFDNEAVSLFD